MYFLLPGIILAAGITSLMLTYQSPTEVMKHESAHNNTIAIPEIDPLTYCSNFSDLLPSLKFNDKMACVLSQTLLAKEAQALWIKASRREKELAGSYIKRLHYPGNQHLVSYLSLGVEGTGLAMRQPDSDKT